MDFKTIGNIIQIPTDSIKVSSDRFRVEMGDIEDLAKSIEEVGQLIPIIVSSDYTLIAGERRLRAIKSLGRPTIDAIVREEHTIDNKIVEAYENIYRKDFNWKEHSLAIEELHNIMKESKGSNWSMRKTAEDIGLSKSGVTTDLDLASALKEVPDIFENCDTKKKALKALQKFKIDETMAEIALRRSKTDYGKNAQKHIFLGNCLDLIDKLPDNLVHAVISDPFYGIDINDCKKSDPDSKVSKIYDDSIDLYHDTMHNLIQKLPRVMKKDAWVVFFCAIQHFQWLYDELVNIGFNPDIMPGIWYKSGTAGQTMQTQTIFGRVYEVFIYAYRGEATLVKCGQPNVLNYSVVANLDKNHPVEKPVALLEDLISRFCTTGSIILDPFAGSGSTLIASIKKGCNPIGFELDLRYYNIVVNNVSSILKLKDAGRVDLYGTQY